MLQRTIHVIVGVISLLFLTGTIEAQSRRPNIVIILADDLGYGDLGSFNRGSKIPTPHLDRLAREGLRLTDAHAPSTSCTPRRTAGE